jgi:hypothetical protein
MYKVESDYEPKRKRLDVLRAQLDLERSSFISHWRDLGDFLLPRRPHLNTTDVNRGEKKNEKVRDSTGSMAIRTMQAGMMAGVTSPARKWFRLTTPDPMLSESFSVKKWLDIVSDRMSTVMLRSNLYQALPTVYGDLGGFGTAAMLVEEDFDQVIRFYAMPIGSYMVGLNSRLKVDVFMREFRVTVRQLVDKFGQKDSKGNVTNWENFSSHVQSLWKEGQRDTWVEVVHAITPNDQYDPRRAMVSKFKRYSSCYYEKGITGAGSTYFVSGEENVYLRERGYDLFPVLVPRWEVTGEDVYGTNCPGMLALGDVKQLQHGEKKKLQALDKLIDPPMNAPAAMRGQAASIVPGKINWIPERNGGVGFQPTYQIQPPFQEIEFVQDQVRNRLRKAFFEDLFLMLASSDRRQITAREIEERHEEKLLALGPVLEQLNQDLLDPLIDHVFEKMLAFGLIPEPPPELQGSPLKVEYLSVLAQAQKLVDVGGIERFAQFALAAAPINPEILDKVDFDQMIDVYGDILSIAPGVVRPDEAVMQIRQARAQAQQAQAQAEMAAQNAQSARNLSQADLSGDNALSRLIDQSKNGETLQ